MVPAVIFFCFLLSGLSSLIYEVLYVRMLILVFGSTTFAISTVLTAFMGGLALGSYLFGRTIDRSRHPVHLYGVLETLIGGSPGRGHDLGCQEFSPGDSETFRRDHFRALESQDGRGVQSLYPVILPDGQPGNEAERGVLPVAPARQDLPRQPKVHLGHFP